MRLLPLALPLLILVAAGVETNYNPECFEILEMLATMEGFDYSNITFAKTLFGDEKINFEVKTWRGNCYYNIGTLNGKVTIVSNKPFKDPTLLAFSDSKTVKDLIRNPDLNSFQRAIETGKIRLEPVGFADKFKFGTTGILSRFIPRNATPAPTLTPPPITQEDFDGDGVLNSFDRCDPYVLKNQTGDRLARIFYYTCPIYGSREEYNGNAPYEDIYDYVLSDGCGLKETDGGVRYYKKGSICVENVTYIPPHEIHRQPRGQPGIVLGHVISRCEAIYTDYCIDNETLVEYYYDPPRRISHPILGVTYLPGQIKNETHKCLFGCVNGQCILKDIDSLHSPANNSCSSTRCGFWPWERGDYYSINELGKKIISLKTGKSIENVSERDDFSDRCLDSSTLKEYYLATEIKIDPFGRLEDHPVVKEENYSCLCEGGRCRAEGDIKIVDVQPVQVVYGAPLIKGKGTAFKVVLDSSFGERIEVELELRLPPNEWNYTGPNKWFIWVPPHTWGYEVVLLGWDVIPATTPNLPSGWSAPMVQNLGVEYRDAPRPIADNVSFTVVANVYEYAFDINPSNNVFTRQNVEVITTKPFRVMYFVHVPDSSYIDVPNNTIKCSVQTASGCKHGSDISLQQMWQNIWNIARDSTEYLLGVAPIADENISFAINFTVNVESNYGGVDNYRNNISNIAASWGYDAAVTIDPCDRCGNANPGPPYVCAIGGAPGSQASTIAHELLSHEILGFIGECYSCTPYINGSLVDCDACVASDGFWVNKWESYEKGKWVDNQGNWEINGSKYYACVGSAREMWQRLDDLWEYNNSSKRLPGGYLDLIRKFKDPNDPTVLVVSGKIHRNGSAEFNKFFEIIEGSVDIEQNTPGEYYIVLLDSEGKVLSKYGFNPSFELLTHEGVVQTDQYPFVFRILWDNKTAKIQLHRENEVLVSKEVSQNKPEIWITSPIKGAVFKENETLIVRWNARDADGDELVFSVGLTKDKENWVPLASNLKNNEYVLSTNYLSRGTYWIKVRATDGVNTAEDISEFFVDVPMVEQQKEVCGNNFCNLRFENSLSCAEDCPSGIKDNICDMIKDNRVDPDCEEGIDPDDTAIYEKDITEAHEKSNLLVYGAISLVAIVLFGIIVGVYKIVRRLRK